MAHAIWEELAHAIWEEFLDCHSIQHYIPRIADHQLARDLAEWPAVLITGPRDIGKTTTALRQSADALRLDTRIGRQLADADPDAAIEGRPAPLLIDEWQLVPDVLGSVKRAVDHRPEDGWLRSRSNPGPLRDHPTPDTWPGYGTNCLQNGLPVASCSTPVPGAIPSATESKQSR